MVNSHDCFTSLFSGQLAIALTLCANSESSPDAVQDIRHASRDIGAYALHRRRISRFNQLSK